MDALALLCNLYADGPATLQRLRRIGCDALAEVAGVERAELVRVFDGDERRARRFVTEAGALADRLAAEPWTSVERGEEASAETAEPDETGAAPPYAGIERVLHAWKELDLAHPPEEPGEYVLPRPAAGEPALEDLRIEGLTHECLAQLGAAGIHTARDLAAAPAVDVVRLTGLPFTRVKRLQFLARRAPASPQPARAERPAPPAGDRLDASGPFA
jgi:hypothetical protein